MRIEAIFENMDEMYAFAHGLIGHRAVECVEDKPDTKEVPGPDPEPAAEEPEPTAEEPGSDPEPQTRTYTKMEVRKVLSDLKKAGKDVSGLIHSLGYEMFKEVPEDKYPELMKKAEDM